MPTVPDDLGHPVALPRPPRRIVSMVPSLTEALAATVPDRLVGATDWCTHPAGLDVTRVRGTKNPDRAAIGDLRPDLVVANREENRRVDVDRLRARGIEVWVTVVESVDQALASLGRLLGGALGVPEPGWLAAARQQWAGPPPLPPWSTVVPIWRDPWMVVGPGTFTGDVVARLGLTNLYGDPTEEVGSRSGRYPRVELADVLARRPELVLLPDEPYAFDAEDGPEAFAGTGARVTLVPGRLLTWYGPSMATARRALVDRIAPAGR